MKKLILSILVCFLISFVSFQVHADLPRIYMQMPILANNPVYSYDDFRVRFFELTGMQIPPPGRTMNVQETHYITGELKTHLTPEIEDILKSEFPMVTFTDGFPTNWTDKEPE